MSKARAGLTAIAEAGAGPRIESPAGQGARQGLHLDLTVLARFGQSRFGSSVFASGRRGAGAQPSRLGTARIQWPFSVTAYCLEDRLLATADKLLQAVAKRDSGAEAEPVGGALWIAPRMLNISRPRRAE